MTSPSRIIPFPLFLLLTTLSLLFCVSLEAGAEEFEYSKASNLLRKEEFTAALALLNESPDEGEIPSVRRIFLKGLCLKGLRQWEEAKAAFLETRGKLPSLSDYSDFYILLSDHHMGKHGDAVERANRFPVEQPGSRLVPESRLILVKSYMALKDWESAETLLREMTGDEENRKNRPELWRLYADVLQERRKIEEAHQALQRIYYDFPAAPESAPAWEKMKALKKKYPKIAFSPPSPSMVHSRLTRLLGSGRHREALQEADAALASKPLPDHLRLDLYMLKGRGHRALRDFSKAVEMYKTCVKKFPSSAKVPECLYRIARIQWNAGNLEEAEKTCRQLIKKYPGNPWSLHGYFVWGGVLEDKKDLASAVKTYERLLEVSPKGDVAEDVSWRVAWIYYLRKDYHKSLEELEKFLNRYPLSPERGRALYWAAKCAESLNNSDKAQEYRRLLMESEPHEFYGHAGRRKTGQDDSSFRIFAGDISRRVFGKISFPESPPGPALNSAAADHLAKSKELLELALYTDAREELRFVHKEINRKNIEEVLWLGSHYYRSRAYRPLLSLMSEFLQTVAPRDRAGLPDLFWRFYYPPAYHEWVSQAGGKYEVDPFLVLGLIRQESAFEEEALSPAEAMGLMQLIPDTGEKTFHKIRKEGTFSKRELYDPEINIDLGVFHLSELLNKNDGDLVKVLIGYNAGMQKTLQWQKKFKDQKGEEFIEMIPYAETRNYVKKVLRNYFNYQRIYGAGNENLSP